MAVGVNVDENGISVKSFREIREVLEAKLKSIFGESLDTSPSSPDGQLIDLFCYAYDDAAKAILASYSNLDLDSAQGAFLDNIGRIMGVERNGMEDDVYRAVLLGASFTGLATYDNMVTYLRANIDPDVTLVANDDPDTDSNGIPGHTIAVYLPSTVTKTDNEIATAIWKCKPAGIGTYGAQTGTATDSVGGAHPVKFNKITSVTYFMKITITEYTEETLPEDYQEQVAAAVADWAVGEYKPGKDIIPKRAIQGVYRVPGIDDVVIEVSANGTSGWTSDRVSIDADKYVSLPKENITVIKDS